MLQLSHTTSGKMSCIIFIGIAMQTVVSGHKKTKPTVHNEGVLARLRQKSVQLHGLLAHEWGLLSGLVVALFLFLVLFSYDPSDAGFFSSGSSSIIHNWGDATGAWISSFLLFLFGVFAYVVPFGVTLVSWVVFRIRMMQSIINQRQFMISGSSLVLFLASGASLATLYLDGQNWFVPLPYSGGGMMGYALAYFFVMTIDRLATTLLFLLAFFVSFSWIIGISWLQIVDLTGEILWLTGQWILRSWQEKWKPALLYAGDWLVEKYQTWRRGERIWPTNEELRAWTSERWAEAVHFARHHLQADKGVLHRPVGGHFQEGSDQTFVVLAPVSVPGMVKSPIIPVLQTKAEAKVAPKTAPHNPIVSIEDANVDDDIHKIDTQQLPPAFERDTEGNGHHMHHLSSLVSEKEMSVHLPESTDFHPVVTKTQAMHHAVEHNMGDLVNLSTPSHADEHNSQTEMEKIVVAAESVTLVSADTVKDSSLPSLELLNPIPENKSALDPKVLQDMGALLEQSLREYNIKAEVVGIVAGPVVTLFELQPAPGVKSGSITNLSKDLARSMSVLAVRVVDIIPGKTVIGIEIPNPIQEAISFREVLASSVYQNTDMILPLVLGKDTAGRPTCADLAKMPHALVAGQTGSGKSVGVNAMIVSLLYHARADEVKFIMIDPKMLELSVYDGIPHLLAPVVTDMSEAANALRWCVIEMERRYQLMSKLGVRNIAGFNEKVQAAIDEGKPIIDPIAPMPVMSTFDMAPPMPTLVPLPYIVVIVDEFADLFMVVGKKVEELIARLAQKARAAGIHLVLATQRPSVDVVTGLIKANIPARISFKVASKIDSRTILDQMGADQLLGRGDMLYLGNGMGSPQRVHGPFVSDDEVHRVVAFLKSQGTPEYITLDPGAALGAGGASAALTGLFEDEAGGAERDVFYDEAVAFVVESRRVSVSSVQRRFSIGYNRAAKIVEAMEAAGLVSAPQNNGSREVLLPE